MYTRVYQGGKRPVPEDYHGTAFSEEMIPEAPLDEESIEEIPTEKEECPPIFEDVDQGSQEQTHEPTFSDAKESMPPPPCKKECKKREDAAWSTELLLLALAALLVQNDAPDIELILVLLFLLLSPAT